MIKKIIFPLCFILFSITFIPADETDEAKLDTHYLEQGNWREENWGTISLHFSSQYQSQDIVKYVINYEDEAPWESDYAYLGQQGSSISFQRIPESDYSKIPDDFFNQTAQVKISTSNFIYSEYLLLEPMGLRLWNLNVFVKAGEQRRFEDIDIIMINQYGIANDNVSIRSGPGTEYSRFGLPLYSGQTFYPSGSEVFVYGRTDEKQVIGEWNAYWYLVHVAEHVMSSYSDPHGIKKWVYGEFIDFKEK